MNYKLKAAIAIWQAVERLANTMYTKVSDARIRAIEALESKREKNLVEHEDRRAANRKRYEQSQRAEQERYAKQLAKTNDEMADLEGLVI